MDTRLSRRLVSSIWNEAAGMRIFLVSARRPHSLDRSDTAQSTAHGAHSTRNLFCIIVCDQPPNADWVVKSLARLADCSVLYE
jgi:hypothetical protein